VFPLVDYVLFGLQLAHAGVPGSDDVPAVVRQCLTVLLRSHDVLSLHVCRVIAGFIALLAG
jgi:hypothetical protein